MSVADLSKLLQEYELELAVGLLLVFLVFVITYKLWCRHQQKQEAIRTMGRKLFPQLDPADPRMLELMNHASKCLFLNLLTSDAILSIYEAAERCNDEDCYCTCNSHYSWYEE